GDAFRGVKIDRLAAHLVGPQPVQPDVLSYSVHPRVEPGSWLPKINSRQGPQAGVLHQVVGLLGVARERVREPAKAWQNRHHPVTDLVAHAPLPAMTLTT